MATRPFSPPWRGTGTLPVIGELHLSTVLLFDLGVYFLVIGSTVLILVALAHQSLRAAIGKARGPGTARGGPRSACAALHCTGGGPEDL